MACKLYTKELRDEGEMMPLQCDQPIHNHPCCLLYINGFPSLEAVPLRLLPSLIITEELMDLELPTYRTVKYEDGVDMMKPEHKQTLRSYVEEMGEFKATRASS
ncbi:hypothetical protein LA080_006216 [Diaporthe eres]|nr:hypothetical protein LA080_006216 [Diaporthe eres]